MNLDSLVRVVQAASISDLRSLVVDFLPLVGINKAFFCDGPYDGGKDFAIYGDQAKGVEIGIQLSVESNWQGKVLTDARKCKAKFNVNLMYFVSSRRIPEGSFESTRKEIFKETGVTVLKYDSQAIATAFTQHNEVNTLLKHLGIDVTPTNLPKKYFSAKNEAVASLLVFDNDVKDFRARLYDSIVKSVLARNEGGLNREELIDEVISTYQMSNAQRALVNSHIDRLLQSKEINSRSKTLYLSSSEMAAYKGLKDSAEYEAGILFERIKQTLSEKNILKDDNNISLLLDNYLTLSCSLIEKNFSLGDNTNGTNASYIAIREILKSKEGEEATEQAFQEISRIIADSEFAKLVSSAKLYDCILNSDSTRLINALGADKSINIYFDSSVVIPLICGILYSAVRDRNSRSGAALYELVSEHSFTSIIPATYAEEISAHLIEACRDYKSILEQGIDMSYSGNAFVSHYCQYIKTENGKNLSFSDYVRVFGISADTISTSMSDTQFYKARDRATGEISRILPKYGFAVETLNPTGVDRAILEIKEILEEKNLRKPDVLVRHDAVVISYLSGAYVPSDIAKILCTWDKIHLSLNPEGLNGYFVMNPIVLIDFLSIAKNSAKEFSLAHILDFAAIQQEKDLELSAKIWDQIAKIEHGKLSDASLMLQASKFKEQFIENNSGQLDSIEDAVREQWQIWKKTFPEQSGVESS
ncbi:TPA: hypothetical protein SMR11_006010 [Pseudomonas aeruginosa]|uniref:hypothetical protein n=1 Tax=Pseudomonas aeruginosa TaxID=287 RepID=UPI001CD22F32|nr:hypothetical protein [Pseudomonas aeruginosa]HBO6794847.1 hypothetical protein [Pseudomonas aeruginosa]HEJ1184957.1 hypothetical protein [Pseudomonas aeruginosa]HEJ1185620.1 hypothetical protein [Pseudomonas aeruginosa]HEJ1253229.1 hypothetical protein [Pseudomonas aeruginosa]HEK0116260.1 hypothetical protein [Pseudomonas aeruginosa]